MEGFKFRCLVRVQDIVRLDPVESGQSSAVDLDIRVGEVTLACVLRESMGITNSAHHRPIWASHPSKAFAKKLRKRLGMA